MSKPAINPETTVAGIAVDPRTLERVIPESRRPDGSYVRLAAHQYRVLMIESYRYRTIYCIVDPYLLDS